MESIEDAIKPCEIKQSFGVNQWQMKKKRYEMEEFLGSPPTHEEGGFFHERFGKPSKSKTSYYNKLPPEYSQDTEELAPPYLGKFRNRSVSIGEVGGAISVDALKGITFDDFSKHPDHSSDIPGLSMSDMSVEAQLFPQVDPLITLKWRRRDSLFKEKATPNFSAVEGKIVQAVKDLNITSKQVTHVDKTEQGFENNTLDTPKTLNVYHQQVKVVSPTRVRKRSSLEEYVTSVSKPTNKSHHHTEDECYREEEEEEEEVDDTSNENHQPVNEGNDTRVRKRSNLQEYLESASKQTNKSHHHAEDEYDVEEKEELQRILKENERDSETLGQKMEITHQNNTNSLNDEYSHLSNTNERTTENQNNEILYEPNKPLDPLEPPVVNYIDENIADQEGAKNESKAQEAVKYTTKEGKEHKKSLLSLLAPFIPFRKSSEESESPATPKEEVNEQKSKSKAVSRFLFTEEHEERKTSSSLETSDLLHNSEHSISEESNNSNNLASASKPKVKKRRPKPSALREMNVWGPSSM